MDEARILKAMERIEGALARIELVALPPIAPPAPQRGLADLEARHTALRNSTQEALIALDALISNTEGQV